MFVCMTVLLAVLAVSCVEGMSSGTEQPAESEKVSSDYFVIAFSADNHGEIAPCG
jgi:hypothetical protein